MQARTTLDSLIKNLAAVEPVGALIGEVFGSYRIVSPLGAGGMGWVFLAEHTMLGSRAAIKVLKPTHSQQQHLVKRFFDEARAASRVADPGIITVLDFGWHPSGAAYLVMEYLTGETLTRRIRNSGRLPPPHALAVIRQCAIAMASAHVRGIVHRDLKPDNIFIVPDRAVASERVKILDFGIAKLLGEGDASHGGTQSGLIMGTPGYMSPEQCRGAGNLDHRTDIYALGCVLFFILTGRSPFIAATPADLIAAHLTMTPPAPGALVSGIAPSLDVLVARCMAKDADQRIQTMLELCAAVDEVAGTTGAPLATALAPVTQPTTTRTKRSRRSLAIAGGLVIAGVATGIVVAQLNTDTETADTATRAPAAERGDRRPSGSATAPAGSGSSGTAPGSGSAVPIEPRAKPDRGRAEAQPKPGAGSARLGGKRPSVDDKPRADAGSAVPSHHDPAPSTGSASGSQAASPGAGKGTDDPYDRR